MPVVRKSPRKCAGRRLAGKLGNVRRTACFRLAVRQDRESVAVRRGGEQAGRLFYCLRRWRDQPTGCVQACFF
jgi:hypothetical protein